MNLNLYLQRYNKFCKYEGNSSQIQTVYCVISTRLLCYYLILSNFRHKLVKFSL